MNRARGDIHSARRQPAKSRAYAFRANTAPTGRHSMAGAPARRSAREHNKNKL